MARIIAYLLFTMLLTCGIKSNAQKASHFIPRETVFFEGDLGKEKASIVPNGWKAEQGQFNIGDVAKPGAVLGHGSAFSLKPEEHNRLPDSFTLEYDVYFPDPHVVDPFIFICFYHPGKSNRDSSGQYCYEFNISTRSMETGNWTAGHLPYYSSPPIKFFDFSKWHQIAISYRLHEVKYFLDGKCLAVIPECGYDPDYLHISNQTGVQGKVRLATGKEVASFKNIITDKKFVTHAINFDVNKATIKPESAPFIKQLADFLNENPKISIEIDGHTDNDGNDAANMTLSQERAEAIKKRLIALGISATRLTTKGFGATKPVKPNTSAESKAENRRIEFIRQ
jgi:OmpA-OmpF porin, OOP family